MKLRNLALAAAVFVGLANMTGAALAQTKVYIVNEEKVRRDSKVGKEMTAALGGIRAQGVDKLGLKPLQDEIKTESDALKPQTQSLTPEAINANPTLKARVDALSKKTTEYLQKADYLNNNLEQSSGSLNMAFAEAMGPAVDHVGKQVGADVVLSYSSTWFVKDAVDISDKVIARLDATVPSLAALQQLLKPAAAPAAPAKPPGGGQ